MPATKANQADILTRGMREVFSTSYQSADTHRAQLFHVLSSQKDYEEFLQRIGFGYFPSEGEMEVVQLQEALLGFKTRITPVRFGLGYQVSKELADDEKYGWIGSLSGELGQALAATKEKHAIDIFNNGFATVWADGKVLFAADHPNKRGGTQRNLLATPVDISYTALQSASLLLAQATTDSGLPMGMDGELIVLTSRTDEFPAAEALKSAGRPDTANRADNVLTKQRRWTHVISDYLSDPDAFFVGVADKRKQRLIFINRMDSTQFTKVDEETYSVKHISRSRFKAGAADWRGWVGTPGAA